MTTSSTATKTTTTLTTTSTTASSSAARRSIAVRAQDNKLTTVQAEAAYSMHHATTAQLNIMNYEAAIIMHDVP
eukprot:3317914-Amphidinium_carterae.1